MNLINAATKRLENFSHESSTPPYAILSHTWFAEETTLQEFRAVEDRAWDSPQARRLTSYSKIDGTCEQALLDGITHVWIDTCCIDKTTSTELDRSINSMFRWYKRARVCYAYLSDVSVNTRASSRSKDSSNDAAREIARSRWFTRGWTLQELIAPPRIEFFSAAWIPLGEKRSMLPLLESISGIHIDALKGARLSRFSVAERMSWASRRVTTMAEDIAYCLLGIFEVNMHPIYGEGKKAFVRLQEEIMKDSDDQSLFAWSPSPSSINRNAHTERNKMSIFAQHPVQYANSGSIHASNFPDYPDEPYRLTNIGVEIEMPLVRVSRDISRSLPDTLEVRAVVLSCIYADSEDYMYPGIVVGRDVGTRSKRWARIAGMDLIEVDPRDVNDARRSKIYLAKKIVD